MTQNKPQRHYHTTRRLDLRGKKRDLFIEMDNCAVFISSVDPLTLIKVTPHPGVVFTSPGGTREIRLERIKEETHEPD